LSILFFYKCTKKETGLGLNMSPRIFAFFGENVQKCSIKGIHSSSKEEKLLKKSEFMICY